MYPFYHGGHITKDLYGGALAMEGGAGPPTVELTSAADATVYAAFSVTATFSKVVTGFDAAADVTVTNGTAGNPVDSGDGKTYTITITPTASGTVTVDIGAGVCTDAAGNANTAAAQLTRLSAAYLTFSCIATGAETLTLQRITPTGGNCVVSWGDGSADSTILADNIGTTTHAYTGAGTYTVNISNASLITYLDLRDTKISWVVSNTRPMPAVTGTLYLHTLAGLTWDVGSVAGTNMPAVTGTLTLHTLAGLTWDVGSVAGANMPNCTSLTLYNLAGLTWDVGSVAGANMPDCTSLTLRTLAGLTWDVGSVAGANMPNCTSLTLVNVDGVTIDAADTLPAALVTFRYESGLSQAEVDAVLAALYLAFPTRTGTDGTIDLLGGGNAAPTGTAPGGAECPPTTGWNTAYELVNDSCGVSAKHWASVSCQT